MAIKRNIPLELQRRSSRNRTNTCKETADLDENPNATKRTKLHDAKPDDIKIEPKHEETLIDSSHTDKNHKKLVQIVQQELCIALPEPHGHMQVHTDELDLERTLLGGQSFRWTKSLFESNTADQSDVKPKFGFKGVVQGRVLQIWRTSDTSIAFHVICDQHPPASQSAGRVESTKALLEDYFQLKYKLRDLYKQWSANDAHLSRCCDSYKGFRILRQDPVENVFSFICATNNNIKRISQMVDKMCKRFGNILIDNTTADNDADKGSQQSIYDCHHAFPTVERLAEPDVFDCLRNELGFGYRAKFIHETAKKLLELSQEQSKSAREYLLSLRQLSKPDTCKQLMQLPGIGRKVADCICLMSMDHLNSIPVDCHIHEIVCKYYMPNLRTERKTLTEAVHDLIAAHFSALHGPLAGWSTSVLFISELRHLKQSAVAGDDASKQQHQSAPKKKKAKKSNK